VTVKNNDAFRKRSRGGTLHFIFVFHFDWSIMSSSDFVSSSDDEDNNNDDSLLDDEAEEVSDEDLETSEEEESDGDDEEGEEQDESVWEEIPQHLLVQPEPQPGPSR